MRTIFCLASSLNSNAEDAELARLVDDVLGARLIEGQKYDEYLPIESWQSGYAREQLDLAGAVRLLNALAP